MTNTPRQTAFVSRHFFIRKVLFLVTLAVISLAFTITATAQYRDYMTAEEIEIIRDAQEIDLRIEALVHMADRRFGVLKLDVASPFAGKKEKFAWGLLPTGERAELFDDIRRILDKAVADIDNLSERPDAAILPDPEEKKPKTLKELFPIAVRNLADAAGRYKPVLTKELESNTDNKIRGSLLNMIDTCDQILDAVKKLPPPEPKKPKKT